MKNTSSKNNPIEDLEYIKDMMEKSSRFISLSGLTGVFAGVFALIGAFVAQIYLSSIGISYQEFANFTTETISLKTTLIMVADAVLVAVFSIVFGLFFTNRTAKKKGLKIWDKTSKRLLINLLIPLAAGGVFCITLLYHNLFAFVAPTTLIFYGFACFNAGKYTHDEVRYLGISEIALGLLGTLYLGYGFVIWMIGFGLLHILYGWLMYVKYEKGK